ncbi:MAG: DUF952 domain-containing protein [Pseudomonadota bacterium]
MQIYKVFRAPEDAAFRAQGRSSGAPIDLADGYIHFSTADQLAETLAKHFTAEADLVLLAVDATLLGSDLKWEPSRGGALFPHLYRDLRQTDVAARWPLSLDDTGTHVLPQGL